mmetsp:Transcript_60527/g.166252  ORF Transcript_60527/g.166252 Transcript_60527/m.166252 type:complete len:295 (+) Transcript_60527:76-960(+)
MLTLRHASTRGHGGGAAISACRRYAAGPQAIFRFSSDPVTRRRHLSTVGTAVADEKDGDVTKMPLGGPSKKTWDVNSCLDDHVEVFASLPKILGAYVGPNKLHPQLGESIMVAVNSANECPYCEGLHGELARMAGVEGSKELQAAQSVRECTAVVDDAAIAYARQFAEANGRGPAVAEAYEKVVAAHGGGQAPSVKAMCWFLTWGSMGGNTLNAILFEGRQKGPFEVAFALYYSPLFLVIAGMNAALAKMPTMPGAFFQGIGVTLTFAGGAWLTPVAVLGLARQAAGGGGKPAP